MAPESNVAEVSNPTCSFCRKSVAEVRVMVAGPSPTFICDECVDIESE